MALSDYDNANGNNPGGQGPLAPQNNSGGGGGGRALNKRWSDLTQKQKDRFGSKSAFSNAKNDYRSQQNVAANAGGGDAYTSTNRSRKAGDKLKDLRQQREVLREDKAGNKAELAKLHERIKRQEGRIYGDGTGNIADNYDASAGGAGSNVNKARTSAKDIKELKQRYGKEAVVDYLNNEGADTLGGDKAQKLLKRYTNQLTNSEVDPDTPVEEVVEDVKDETTPPGNDNEPPGATDPADPVDPDPVHTSPGETTGPVDDDMEQTDDTLSGGGISTGDADNGGVSAVGDNNTGGNNDNSQGGASGGAGSTVTGGNNDNSEGGVSTGTNNGNVTGGNNDLSDSTGSVVGNQSQGGTNAYNNLTMEKGSGNFYGGDVQGNMQINYGEGATSYNTAPVSDLTMMGYGNFGKPSDSPGTQAKFVSMYQQLNKDAQAQYKNIGTSTANQYIENAAETNPIDYVALNKEIGRSIERHYNNSTEQGALYMGDPYNYRPPTYEMPEPLKPVENNVAETTENAQENLDDED